MLPFYHELSLFRAQDPEMDENPLVMSNLDPVELRRWSIDRAPSTVLTSKLTPYTIEDSACQECYNPMVPDICRIDKPKFDI